MQQSTFLNEYNWQEVISQREHFPFRASEIFAINKELGLSKVSFKYNVLGHETYYNGHKEVGLKKGEYLLATNQTKCEVEIKETEEADIGICVDIDIRYLQQAFDMLLHPNELAFSSDKDYYLIDQDLFEKFPSNPFFHEYMKHLYGVIKEKNIYSIQELEYSFIKHFVPYHFPNTQTFHRIPATKKSTRAELYSKMLLAKNRMEGAVYGCINLADFSRELYISEFRFLHVFKTTYGISPYKYLLQLKMEEALKLRQQDKYTWTEIAEKLCFADLPSFSKAFKRHYGCSPTLY
jgi:AraC family transcriptional regulator